MIKILHITASYQPAYVYGGPIYSVAALCEELVESRRSGDRSPKSGVRSWESEVNPNEDLSFRRDEAERIAVTVYTTLANGKEELPYQNGEVKLVNGVPVHYFKRITKDHSHFSPSLLWRVWKDAKKYDAIHIHSWWNLVSMGAVLICVLKGIKPIVSPRGMLGDYTFTPSKKRFHRIFGRWLLRHCHFHATTLMEAEEIVKRVGRKESEDRGQRLGVKSIEIVDLMAEESGDGGPKSGVQGEKFKVKSSKWRKKISIFVIHNIVQVPKPLPQRSRIFDGTLKLIFLSRIHPKKGIELLLDALAEVAFPFELSIVGEGEGDYVKSLKFKVESLKLSDYIHWKGAVYGAEKFELLAAHDLFVLPSFNENFANVVIEAIAVGIPVLVSDQVGLYRYITQHHLGWVTPLDELNSHLEQVYLQFTKNKPDFSHGLALIQAPLIDKYLNLY